MAGRIAIVCAMAVEIKPLVRRWGKVRERGLTFFESEMAVAVVAGIGSAPAALAAMTLVAREQPSCLVSAGFVGALRRDLKVGDVLLAANGDQRRDGQALCFAGSVEAKGTIVSGRGLPARSGSASCANSSTRMPIDMEGAGVASIAESCGLPFYAMKAVSDEMDFPMPPMNEFVDTEGKFHIAGFAAEGAGSSEVVGTDVGAGAK